MILRIYVDPFNNYYPNKIERTLDDGLVNCMTLSKNGHWMATANETGNIAIWDMHSYFKIKTIEYGKGLKASNLSFNRKATSIAVLNEERKCIRILKTTTIVPKSDIKTFTDQGSNIILAAFIWGSVQTLGDDCNNTMVVVNEDFKLFFWDISNDKKVYIDYYAKKNVQVTCASLSKSRLYVCDSKNNIHVFCLKRRRLLKVFDEDEIFGSDNPSPICGITAHPSRREIQLITRNKMFRLYSLTRNVEDLVIQHRFVDAVNRWNWKLTGFSHQSEYDSSMSWAVAVAKGRHLVYFWEQATGAPVPGVEGPQEEILTAAWHPRKSLLITVCAVSGLIYIWRPDYPQKWAALVPNIEALETNMEYIEREDEFDIVTAEMKKRRQEIEEDGPVDVVTRPFEAIKTSDSDADSYDESDEKMLFSL